MDWDSEWKNLPESLKRFDSEPCVLGSEGFTSRTQYWETELGVRGPWTMGVAREYVKRKERISLKHEEGIWALQKWRCLSWTLTSQKTPCLCMEPVINIKGRVTSIQCYKIPLGQKQNPSTSKGLRS
ncbi:unnamed protein product [Natator depressus]